MMKKVKESIMVIGALFVGTMVAYGMLTVVANVINGLMINIVG